MAVASPGRTIVKVVGGDAVQGHGMRVHVPGADRLRDLGVLGRAEWDPRAGLGAGAMLEHNPWSLRRRGVTHVYLDWDGTLACSDEGFSDKVTEEDLHDEPLMRSLATFLFGGTHRMRQVGEWLHGLHRKGIKVRVLTRNPVDDRTLTAVLRQVAPRVDASWWRAAWPGKRTGCDIHGGMEGPYRRINLLHSDDKLRTIQRLGRH